MLLTPPHTSHSGCIASRNHRRQAFTLVELLAVIAILGVLAAILIPVVSHVRSTVLSTQCTANLRQIGAGYQQYLNDYQGIVPIGWVNRNGETNIQEKYNLPYSGGWIDYYYNTIPTEQRVIMGCPLQRENKEDIWRAANKTPQQIRTYRTYGFNGDLGFDLSAGEVKPKHITLYDSPGSTILIADGNNSDANGTAGYYNAGITHYRLPEAVHDGQANILFLDGHVESLALEDIPVDISSGTDGRIFWYGTRQ